jgi:hypothetical protein
VVPPQIGNEGVHDEATLRFEVRGDVPEATDLFGLGRQCEERGEHDVHQSEQSVHAHVGRVPHRDRDDITARLATQFRDHAIGGVDPHDVDAAFS